MTDGARNGFGGSRQSRWQAKKIAEGFCATCGHRYCAPKAECSVCRRKKATARRVKYRTDDAYRARELARHRAHYAKKVLTERQRT